MSAAGIGPAAPGVLELAAASWHRCHRVRSGARREFAHMVEPLLYAGLGFLVASLLFLFLGRVLWLRAVALTTERLLRRLPTSRASIIAEQDFVRADAAVTVRKIERRAGRLQVELAEAKADLGRRDSLIRRLKGDIAAAKTSLAAAEAMRGEIDALRTERAAAQMTASSAEGALARANTALKQAEAARAALQEQLDAGKLEVAALRMHLAAAEAAAAHAAHAAAAAREAGSTALEAARKGVADAEAVLRARLAALEADLGAARKAGQGATAEAAAARAQLRERLEQLAGEISRQAAAPPAGRPPHRHGADPLAEVAGESR
jgi:chromosome segregation ATPase